jgi:hypothetical protein
LTARDAHAGIERRAGRRLCHAVDTPVREEAAMSTKTRKYDVACHRLMWHASRQSAAAFEMLSGFSCPVIPGTAAANAKERLLSLIGTG